MIKTRMICNKCMNESIWAINQFVQLPSTLIVHKNENFEYIIDNLELIDNKYGYKYEYKLSICCCYEKMHYTANIMSLNDQISFNINTMHGKNKLILTKKMTNICTLMYCLNKKSKLMKNDFDSSLGSLILINTKLNNKTFDKRICEFINEKNDQILKKFSSIVKNGTSKLGIKKSISKLDNEAYSKLFNLFESQIERLFQSQKIDIITLD